MQIDRFSLVVLIGGRPAREYGLDGRTYIAGGPGKTYTIRLVSRSPRRCKAVLAVDGLSAIDGKPAGGEGHGYVLDPWAAIDVPGWRLSDEQVARFVFSGSEQSYAAEKGKAENEGVIGVKFFDEVTRTPPPVALTAAPVPTAFAKGGPGLARNGVIRTQSLGTPGALGGSLGTGFGAKTDHVVRRVEFEARPHPAAVIEVRYEDAAILRGLGVDVPDDADLLHAPQAFPADAGYCAPPPNWRG